MPVEIDKSDRTELKAFFVQNAIPTESNFADLIDAAVNQKDDGLAKAANNPLSIEAGASAPADKKVLNLYQSFADAKPAWVVSLNSGKRQGLAIANGAERAATPRLFIDAETGNVGVGNTAPSDSLDVSGSLKIISDSNPILFTSKWTAFPDNKMNGAEISNDTSTYKTLMIVGNKSNSAGVRGGVRRVSVWDRLEVNGTLKVTGAVEIGGTLTVTGQDPWKAVTFNPKNKWVNYGFEYTGAEYYKDSLGVVHLRGLMKGGSVGSNGAFTLPAGYRPTGREIFAAQTHPNTIARVDVEANGVVSVQTGNTGWVSLSGITFSTT